MLHTKSIGLFSRELDILRVLPFMGVVALTFETYIAIVSLVFTYQVRIMTLASTVFTNLTFKCNRKPI